MKASEQGENAVGCEKGDPNLRLNACLNKEASGRTRQESRLLEPGKWCLDVSQAAQPCAISRRAAGGKQWTGVQPDRACQLLLAPTVPAPPSRF